jgi:hypothetical protein
MLLRVKNFGAGVAYDVRLAWNQHPQNEEGEQVSGLDVISAIMPQDSLSVFVGRSNVLFTKYPLMRFEGAVEFKDVTGRRIRRQFICNADDHRHGLSFDDELPKTLHDLQRIPQSLEDIRNAIRAAGDGAE